MELTGKEFKAKVFENLKKNYKNYPDNQKASFQDGYLAAQKLDKKFDNSLYKLLKVLEEGDTPVPVLDITMFNSMMHQFQNINQKLDIIPSKAIEQIQDLHTNFITKSDVKLSAKEKRQRKANSLIANTNESTRKIK